MAGVTDRPYRRLCRRLGAGYAVSEMAASDPRLRDSVKTARRLDHQGEGEPVAVQLAGACPDMLAEAAVYNIHKGAHIIDINMGCPVRKVCRTAAGSALLRDEDLVARILDRVVSACQVHDVPVTLKTRTGWDADSRNAVRIACRAREAGIAALFLHGRTRCDLYRGQAEYDTIRTVKQAVDIPVIANGDIDSPLKARQVLDYTGADAVMIGRAAQGRPWIFGQISHFLEHGDVPPAPTHGQLRTLLLEHLEDHYQFHGEHAGVRTARKHIGWYLAALPDAGEWLPLIKRIETTAGQARMLDRWLAQYPSEQPFMTDSATSLAV